MIKKQRGPISWLEFEIFQKYPELKHGVFSKHGGHSHGAFSSLNVGLGIGDDEDIVKKNRSCITSILNTPNLYSPHQVHKDQVLLLNKHEPLHEPADGIATHLLDTTLMIKHADCQAAIFFDPIKKVIACVHAGWRGSCLNIYQKTISLLIETFGCSPTDILVGISPSLGPEHAEFIHYQTELPPSFWSYQVKKNHFDFWKISRDQLIAAGLRDENIEVAGICTYASSQDFFSYRRDNKCGRNATVVALSS